MQSKALVSHNHQATHLPCGWLRLTEMELEMQPQALPGSCCLDHRVQVISELSGYIHNCQGADVGHKPPGNLPSILGPPNLGGWLVLMVSSAELFQSQPKGLVHVCRSSRRHFFSDISGSFR